MTARPLLQRVSREIEARGGEDWFFDLIAGGMSLGKMAKNELGGLCSRQYLYKWIRMAPHKERREEMYETSKRLSAEALVEDGGDILDDLEKKVVVMSSDVSLALARSNYRKWLAGKRNPAEFGDEKAQVNVNVSLGSMHLDALRAVRGHAVGTAVDPPLLTEGSGYETVSKEG